MWASWTAWHGNINFRLITNMKQLLFLQFDFALTTGTDIHIILVSFLIGDLFKNVWFVAQRNCFSIQFSLKCSFGKYSRECCFQSKAHYKNIIYQNVITVDICWHKSCWYYTTLSELFEPQQVFQYKSDPNLVWPVMMQASNDFI